MHQLSIQLLLRSLHVQLSAGRAAGDDVSAAFAVLPGDELSATLLLAAGDNVSTNDVLRTANDVLHDHHRSARGGRAERSGGGAGQRAADGSGSAGGAESGRV